MLQLSVTTSGELSADQSFGEVFLAAIIARFTGGLLLEAPGGQAALFFRGGQPTHAAGPVFQEHYIGQLLIDAGATDQAAVEAAVASQSNAPGPLLGALLAQSSGVSQGAIKTAVIRQNQERAAFLFAAEAGTWRAASGENERIRALGVPTSGWPILFGGLAKHGDKDLRRFSKGLLGKAVHLENKPAELDQFELTPLQARLLKYLEKPRKPDQLERALKDRRAVRAFLRMLQLLGGLGEVPVAKAIAIPKATLLKGADLPPLPSSRAPEPAAQPEPVAETPKAAEPAVQTVSKNHPLLKEVEKLHKQLDEISHFDLLGVDEKTQPLDIRKRFTDIAKKFHPDAFPSGAPPESQEKAREISARANEAYQTLSNPSRRAEYLTLLSDHRIRGDSKRAEKVRDAEVKAKMADVLVKKREFGKARELLKLCVNNDPATPEYKATLAWAWFADPGVDRTEAQRMAQPLLQEALQSKPSADAHYYMGQLLKEQEKVREATFHFKRATELDRKHREAARELRLITMRDKKAREDKEKPTGWSKIFKK